MKRLIILVLSFAFILCLCSTAFATGYSGSASHYFDTSSQNKSGASWAKMTDTCYTVQATQGPNVHLGSIKDCVPVNGSIALAPKVLANSFSVVNFNWTSGANSYSSAKLRNYAIDEPIKATGDWTAY